MRYFDTSVLLKLYLREPNSPQAVALVRKKGEVPLLSGLHRVEMKGAITQKQARGEITETERAAVLASLDRDLAAGVFADVVVSWPAVFAKAEEFATAHVGTTLCRSLDLLHVALASELGAAEFCTLDQRQTAMARAVGLIVVS